MGILPAFRRLGRLAPVVLLLVLALRPAGYLLSELLAHQHLETPVEASRIEVPGGGPETCEHHPAGCPKGCFCPKTHARAHAHEEQGREPSLAKGDLRRPSLAHCTRQDGSEGFPSGPAFQAPEWRLTAPARRVERLVRAPHSALLPQEADPPLKVPIA